MCLTALLMPACQGLAPKHIEKSSQGEQPFVEATIPIPLERARSAVRSAFKQPVRSAIAPTLDMKRFRISGMKAPGTDGTPPPTEMQMRANAQGNPALGEVLPGFHNDQRSVAPTTRDRRAVLDLILTEARKSEEPKP